MIGDLPETVGRYRVLDELGHGSMARVLLARDPNTDRDVALKVVAESGEGASVEQEEARRRFLLEARAAGRLHHPAIVMIYDADVDPESGAAYMAMEWVRGRSLAELLQDRGKLTPREAVAIAADVGAALDHAHGRQVIHRDVKPANILIGDDGAVKVSDFGIAKFVAESNTMWGQILGSPSYMSPEQVKNEAVDGRSDLFSLGAVVYEMLTGASPFQGDSVASIVYKIANVDPRPPSLLDRSIGSALDAVILRALDKDPARRFQSGAELAEALEGALEGIAPPTAAGGAAGSGTRPAAGSSPARPGARIGLVAAAVILLLATGGLALRYGPFAPTGPEEEPSAMADSPSAIEDSPSAMADSPSAIETNPSAMADNPSAIEDSPSAASDSSSERSGEPFASVEDRSTLGDDPPAGSAAPVADPPARAVEGRTRDGEAPSRSAEASTLRLVHKNRLEDALLTVWVDGDRVLSLRLEGAKGVLGRVAGDEVTAPISLDPGMHTVEVRITAVDGGRADARGVLRSNFAPGRTRLLRIVRRPYSDRLRLSWEEEPAE